MNSKNKDKNQFSLEIVLIYCKNCLKDAAVNQAEFQKVSSFQIHPTMVPCSSKIQVSTLLQILENGADGIELAACTEDSCQQLVGSRRTEKRVKYVQKLLEEIHISGERVGFTMKNNRSLQDLINLARERAKIVKQLGPNIMKE